MPATRVLMSLEHGKSIFVSETLLTISLSFWPSLSSTQSVSISEQHYEKTSRITHLDESEIIKNNIQ